MSLVDQMRELLNPPTKAVVESQNPLEVLGFSSTLLSLGFNQKQLHRYCLRCARAALAAVHSDQEDSGSSDIQTRFSGAFEAIKDFEKFTEALATLKQEHAFFQDRSNRYKRQITELQERLRNASQDLLEIKSKPALDRNLHNAFQTYVALSLRPVKQQRKIGHELRIGALDEVVELFCIRIELDPHHQLPTSQAFGRFKEKYTPSIDGLRGFDGLDTEGFLSAVKKGRSREHFLTEIVEGLQRFSLNATSTLRLFEKTLDELDELPQIIWTERDWFAAAGISDVLSGHDFPLLRGFSVPEESEVYKNNRSVLLRQTRDAVRGIKNWISDSYRFASRLVVIPTILRLKNGVIISENGIEKSQAEQVIGTIPSDSYNLLSLHSGTFVCRQDSLLGVLFPVIMPKSFLITRAQNTLTLKSSDSKSLYARTEDFLRTAATREPSTAWARYLMVAVIE